MRIALNFKPACKSWGGGNQWAHQMVRFIEGHGHEVSFDLKPFLDCIIMVDPRKGDLKRFGAEDIADYKSRRPGVPCLHRINECDLRKGTQEMDPLLRRANQCADFTVFISGWLLEYHASRWFDKRRPHAVIHNGADDLVFCPAGGESASLDKKFRIVTHHWSDNWNKGFSAYQQIDRLIADGELDDVELWVIGRWPKELRWRAAKTFGPVEGSRLAALLRQCHAYVTASLWEPGGMHFIEGAQCGLPVIYHEEGGGIVEVAKNFGVPFRTDIQRAILYARNNYNLLRSKVLQYSPSGVRMCSEYFEIIRRLAGDGR